MSDGPSDVDNLLAMDPDEMSEAVYDEPMNAILDPDEEQKEGYKLDLSEGERNSPLWKKLDEFFAIRMLTFRQANDSDLDTIETSKNRGKIALLKELREYGDKPTTATQVEAHDLGY